MAILQDLSKDDLIALVAKLQATKAAGRCTLKVGEKGNVSLYGLGRFPVSLYRSQWDKLLAHADEIRDFIKANEGLLSVKD